MIAGAGDELQGIKRGILELADAIAINKADGDNIERALSARQQYETAFHLITPPGKDWVPPVVTCSALTGDGLAEIYNLILVHRQKLLASGDLEKKRMAQARDWFWSLVREGLEQWFFQNTRVKSELQFLQDEGGTRDPFTSHSCPSPSVPHHRISP